MDYGMMVLYFFRHYGIVFLASHVYLFVHGTFSDFATAQLSELNGNDACALEACRPRTETSSGGLSMVASPIPYRLRNRAVSCLQWVYTRSVFGCVIDIKERSF